MAVAAGSSVRLAGRLDPGISRWLWLVKWFLAIPHYVVLAFLWAAFAVLSVIAFFAILFTGRYPRSVFDFNVGVLRWSWRVAYYSYGALGTDRYPPFTLADVPDYPARLDVAYPEHLSRGLVLVKWWLLAIPHYLVIALFLGGVTYVGTQAGDWVVRSPVTGLISLLVVIAAVALAVTGRYPRGIFDLVLGLNRWVYRVVAYAALMTDEYPPFRLDVGEREPAVLEFGSGRFDLSKVHPVEPVPPLSPPALPPARPMGAGRVVALVLGSVVALGSFGLLAGGAAALVVDQTSATPAATSPARRSTSPVAPTRSSAPAWRSTPTCRTGCRCATSSVRCRSATTPETATCSWAWPGHPMPPRTWTVSATTRWSGSLATT